jgi:hypothetical protein
MDSERATVVAMNASGVTVIAIVAAGTRTPPMPKPAIAPNATALAGVSGFMVAKAPPKAAE